MQSTPTRSQGANARRRALLAGAAALLPLMNARAQAQAFPARPLTLVVPFPPGGGFDTVARPFAERMGRILGQPVVVDNRPGASGNIGAEAVARAAADGYTLLFANDFLATNPVLSRSARYDPLKDYTPVGLVAAAQVAVVVRPDFPAKSFAELVTLSQRRPLTYGSPGIGTSVHLVGEYLSTVSPVRTLHVPYKGTAPMVTDTIGGQIDMAFATTPSVAGHLAAGRLRAVAALGRQRSAHLPDVPTIVELGGPLVDYEVWYSVFAPAGVPPDVLRALREALKAAQDPGLSRQLGTLGYEVREGDAAEVTRLIARDSARWRDVARQARVTVD